ncbi:MAG: putative nucleic acid-binding Zn-ribbon protein [Flavobacteriales bacterium]|jgi:predicted  nucleic acid-binding Zn-ribbon protein
MSKVAKSPEQKLRALFDLQVIDSMIDKIRIVRGELPLEVQDLEDEVEGLDTRIANYQSEMDKVEEDINGKKNTIQEALSLIKKYEEKQSNVRNNREYDSLNKELEFQGLEIQLCEKKIREFEYQKEQKQVVMDKSVERVTERRADLDSKKSELSEIVEETKREEEILLKMSDSYGTEIDDRLLTAYKRIRGAAKNGMAVVPIDREASAGSFIKIPPQKQLDVAARKKIIVDEHSGRILVDQALAVEEREKIESLIKKELKS